MARLGVDCLRVIFIKLQNDPRSLYSCILVNRSWCQIAVPILWKNPFVFNRINHISLYNTIINSLPAASKQLLSDNDVELSLSKFSSKPLFNYIIFFSEISSKFINDMVHTLIEEDIPNKNYKKDLLEQEVYKLFINDCKNIKDFCWQTKQSLSQYPGASTCFSCLHALTIDLQYVTSIALLEMAGICQNIEDLNIWYCNGDIPGLIELIDTQKILQTLYIHFKNVIKQCIQLSEAIERKAATIKAITISPNITLLSPKFLPSLINLERLELKNSRVFEWLVEKMEEWNKYFAIASFPNLQYLTIESLPICDDYMLIEKSHGNILEIYKKRHMFDNHDPVYTKKLLKAIALYCPKIESLTINVELEDLKGIKEILLNCLQLSQIHFITDNDEELCCDELLGILTKFSPKSLYTFIFNENWIFSAERVNFFHENYRGDIPIEFCYGNC